ncbi:MAG TPA: VCBS repeat-containing protein [Pirellulaceae bacterium]|nr:VCBS repeat-containing protein [Pirellulaceae bacterium]HMO91566.1 VCBS repeat-containing protein [Pirellulaceae bacterium]HMP68263.1 VCBS repeat-containing protein [Pirellulaceae bacterium]
MSNKRRQGKTKRDLQRQAASAKARGITGSRQATDSGKRHLNPAVVAAVIIPLLVVSCIVIWLNLRSEISTNDNNQIAKSDDLDSHLTSHGQPVSPASVPAWVARDKEIRDAWKTEEDCAREWDRIDDPTVDGWNTEVISDRITAHYNYLKKAILSGKPISTETVEKMVDPDLRVSTLYPADFTTVYLDDQLTVQRGVFDLQTEDENSARDSDAELTGADAFSRAWMQILEPYIDRTKLTFKLKVFRVLVEPTGDTVRTQQTLELFGATATGVREENAAWEIIWTNEPVPRMLSLDVTGFERVDSLEGTLFADCTTAVFGNEESFRKSVMLGYDQWLERSQINIPFVLLGNNGIAIADVDGDGLDDIYICQEAGLPNLLYLQNPDGTVRDVSADSGIDFLQNSSTAVFADLNNNGIKDVLIAVTGGVVVAEGDGTGRFQIRNVIDTADYIWSLNVIDFDQDGWLDFYVGAYSADGASNIAANVVITGDDGEFVAGGRNALYRNTSALRSFQFEDVTEDVGLLANNFRYTFASAWDDFDNDGLPDLYVANDFGWNNLYRAEARADGSIYFHDIAAEAHAQDDSFGMSVNWVDFDRDGWMDVYISNMFSYAGNRITTQETFKVEADHDIKQRFQRYARGNTLLRNLGAKQVQEVTESLSELATDHLGFEDVSVESGVNMGRWAWGSAFIDFNNNGWEDIFVNNGYITSADTGDL